MAKINEKLKQIRLKLNLTQKEFSNKVIDHSFYSRVENDKNQITDTDLIKLLQTNNYSIVNFLTDFGNTLPKDKVYQDKILNAFLDQDTLVLKRIISDKKLTNFILKLISNDMIKKIKSPKEQIKIANSLKKYFSKIEIWENTDYLNLLLVEILYSYQDWQNFVDKALTYFKRSQDENSLNLSIVADVAVYCLKISSSKNDYFKANEMIDFLTKMPIYKEIFLQKLIGKYYECNYSENKIVIKKIEKYLTKSKYGQILIFSKNCK